MFRETEEAPREGRPEAPIARRVGHSRRRARRGIYACRWRTEDYVQTTTTADGPTPAARTASSRRSRTPPASRATAWPRAPRGGAEAAEDAVPCTWRGRGGLSWARRAENCRRSAADVRHGASAPGAPGSAAGHAPKAVTLAAAGPSWSAAPSARARRGSNAPSGAPAAHHARGSCAARVSSHRRRRGGRDAGSASARCGRRVLAESLGPPLARHAGGRGRR